MKIFGYELKKIDPYEIHWLPVLLKKNAKLKSEHSYLSDRVDTLERNLDETHETLMRFLKGLAGVKND